MVSARKSHKPGFLIQRLAPPSACMSPCLTCHLAGAMHFSIPLTEELYEDAAARKGQYTAYQIHLNGGFLCSVRYNRLHDFNEQVS